MSRQGCETGKAPDAAAADRIRVRGPRLLGEARAAAELTTVERQRMLELMGAHFEAVEPARFFGDLDEKQWVLCLSCARTGVLQGFSTAMLLDTALDGRPARAIFSGDTIIERQYWGEWTVGKLWLRFALAQQQLRPDCPLYWFLISMGHRTYRLLRIFFHTYWPRRDQPTPDHERRLLDHFGRLKCGQSYDPQRGVVSHGGRRERMRPEVAHIPEGRRRDPDIAFFLERNPGWDRGDELACLAELSPANIRPAARRVFQLEDLD